MELTQQKLEEYAPQINQTIEEFEISPEEEDSFIEELKENFEDVSERKSSGVLPEGIILRKALGKTTAALAQRGDRFNMYILGIGKPTDWNRWDRMEIIEAWEKGPRAQQELKEQGKVATIKVRGEEKVLDATEDYNYRKSDSGKCVFTEGVPIEETEGGEPLPLDYEETKRNSDEANPHYGFPLGESWSLNIWALSEVEKDNWIPTVIKVYRSQADPSSENFIGNSMETFKEYRCVVNVDKDNSGKGYLRCNGINSFLPVEKDDDITVEQEVYGMVGTFIPDYKDGDFDEHDFVFVDIKDIENLHNEFFAKRDENGEVIKSKSGYDKTHWDRLAIGSFRVFQSKPTKTGNLQLQLSDWSGSGYSVFVDPNEIGELGEEQEIFISFATTRKPTRWDPESNENIEDPINGDVVINRLRGIYLIPEE